jgi:hypothetical protein
MDRRHDPKKRISSPPAAPVFRVRCENGGIVEEPFPMRFLQSGNSV